MAESAGLILYRMTDDGIEVLIGHPGGPFWAKKDAGAWSIPKGLIEPGEAALATAIREFTEETGFEVPAGEPISLGSVTQKSGKRIQAWALRGDADPAKLDSNPVVMKWPPRTGSSISFPELDRVIWATPDIAAEKLNRAQVPLVTRLVQHVSDGS